MSTTRELESPSGLRPARARTVARTVLPVAGLALVANLIIHSVAAVLGTDFQVRSPFAAEAIEVTLPQVVAMSLVPVLLAGALALAVGRWAPRSWLVLAWAGLAVGVLSMPVLMLASASTKLALSLMHLVTAGLWWHQLRRAAHGMGPRR